MSGPSPSIAVVMSTYNGASYVEAQLESILAQDCPNVHVVVRDDGSSDETVAILRPYADRGDIEFIEGHNVGLVSSFIGLVAHVAGKYDYVALCDQDDIWHRDKLSRAVAMLGPLDQGMPQLYCSEYTYCDESMNPTGRSHLNQIGVTFETQLYENMVSGNTCVLNRRLSELVAEAGIEGVYCHDWWISLIACALGGLVFDDFSSLDYRRTGSNASPSGTHGLKLLVRRVKIFFGRGELGNVTMQLERLYKLFAPQMPAAKRAFLERFLRGGRVRKLATPARLRQRLVDEAALRLLFLVGLL